MSKRTDTTASSEILFKIHRRGGEVVLAACDKEHIDGSWKEGKRRLASPRAFYFQDSCDDPAKLTDMMSMCTQANLIGARVIEQFVKEGFIDPGAILKVEGVPHAIFVRMP